MPDASETDRIRDQLRRAVHGGAWHGPSVAEAIDELDPPRAWSRLSPGTHSPVELVLHIALWLEIVARRFTGKAVPPAQEEEQDWRPAPEESDVAWTQAVQRLHRAHGALDRLLTSTEDEHLCATVPGQEITMYHMLHGAVQHTTYHAGQIVLISRALGELP